MKNKLFLFGTVLMLFSITSSIKALGSSELNPLIFADVVITSNYSGFPISCSGAADGSAIVYPTGGLAPYEILWSTGLIGQEAFGLSEGIYTITVVDATLATVITELVISGPPQIDINIIQISADSLDAIVTGGVPPYFYTWSTGDTGPSLGNLIQGAYSVTINDANGCIESAIYNLTSQPTTGPGWEYTITNESHFIIIPDTVDFLINGNPTEPGDMMGVFFDSLGTVSCGGYGIWDGLTITLTAYGDNPITPGIDGFGPGEEFIWKIWDVSAEEEFLANPIYNLNSFPNNGHYFNNGISGLLALHGYSQQMINIPSGWSIISTYIDPFFPNVEDVFSDIILDVILIKNESGELYFPLWNLNMIGDVTIGEGYQIKMVDNGGLKSVFVLIVNGEKIDPDVGIELNEGWSIISYLHDNTYPIEDMLQGIDSVIDIVKDGNGNVYIPNPPYGPVNTIIELSPGKGYKIKILAGNNVILYYPDSIPGVTKYIPFTEPIFDDSHFAKATNTGNNHSFIFANNRFNSQINYGDEVAIFSQGKLIGSKVYTYGDLVIPAFGDDETTPFKDGPVTKDEINIRLWNCKDAIEYTLVNIDWISGDQFYKEDKISIINEFDIEFLYAEEESITINPNPNNGVFSISTNIREKVLRVELTNGEGKILFSKRDIFNPNYDLSEFASGIYMIRILTKNNSFIKKFIIQ